MDFVAEDVRSRMMSAVRSKNTTPEVEIRRRLFRLGYRYRVNDVRLPGKPDIVFPKYNAVVFVNGCFWHSHHCRFGGIPKTRTDWWKRKLENNRRRDAAILEELHRRSWRTIVIWECSFRQPGVNRRHVFDDVAVRISHFLQSSKANDAIEAPPKKTGDRKRDERKF